MNVFILVCCWVMAIMLLPPTTTITIVTGQEFNIYRDYSHSAIRPIRYAKKSVHHDVSEYLSVRQKLMVERRKANPNSSNSYSNTGSINSFYLRGSRKLMEMDTDTEVGDENADVEGASTTWGNILLTSIHNILLAQS